MNPSSLFSFEESSDWDPKSIVKHLIPPQDVLTRLNSIPGWNKVQENQNTLRLDSDFSILSSQSECDANSTHKSLRIEKNTKLFDEGTENRKSVLETYKGYRKKLTRSLSFSTVNTNCRNLCNGTTLKRSSSLQSLSDLSDAPDKVKHCKNFICEELAKSHLSSGHSKFRKSLEVLSKGLIITGKNMETVTELPVVDISTPIENGTLYAGGSNENTGILAAKNVEVMRENDVLHVKTADLYFEASKESSALLADKNVEIAKGNDVLHVKNDLHFEATKESNGILASNVSEIVTETNDVLPVENTNLHLEATKESNGTLHTDDADLQAVTTKDGDNVLISENVALESNDIADELVKDDNECESANANNAELHTEIPKENNSVDNVDLNSEAAKGSNGVLPAANNMPCSNKTFDEPAETAIKDSMNIDNPIESPMSKVIESQVSAIVDVAALIIYDKEEKPMDTTPSNHSTVVEDEDKVVRDPNPPSVIECFVSSVTSGEKTAQKIIAVISTKESNVIDLCHSKSSVEVPADLPKKEAENTCSVGNSVTDVKVNDDEKVSDKTCDPSKSSTNDDASVSKKRKLESRNKRYKRRKSEEKNGSLKIRSIKKVAEICYNAEEVKTMLDIMEQLL